MRCLRPTSGSVASLSFPYPIHLSQVNRVIRSITTPSLSIHPPSSSDLRRHTIHRSHCSHHLHFPWLHIRTQQIRRYDVVRVDAKRYVAHKPPAHISIQVFVLGASECEDRVSDTRGIYAAKEIAGGAFTERSQGKVEGTEDCGNPVSLVIKVKRDRKRAQSLRWIGRETGKSYNNGISLPSCVPGGHQ